MDALPAVRNAACGVYERASGKIRGQAKAEDDEPASAAYGEVKSV